MAMQLMSGAPNEIVNSPIFVSTFAAILSGSVLGDHCSPISDTTILSSTASGADHIDHVRTQLPYSITVGIVALIFGYLFIGFGGNQVRDKVRSGSKWFVISFQEMIDELKRKVPRSS